MDEEAGGSHQLRAILDQVGETLFSLEAFSDVVAQSLKGRLRRGFKAVYPVLNTAFEVWLVACNMAYVFDRTSFYRPWLSWIDVDLRRLGVEDFVSCPSHSEPFSQ
jgi:peroxin-12